MTIAPKESGLADAPFQLIETPAHAQHATASLTSLRTLFYG